MAELTEKQLLTQAVKSQPTDAAALRDVQLAPGGGEVAFRATDIAIIIALNEEFLACADLLGLATGTRKGAMTQGVGSTEFRLSLTTRGGRAYACVVSVLGD